MTRRRSRSFVAWPRHPLTGRQFRVSAYTQRELDAYLQRISSLGEDLRLGMASAADVDRALRRVVHGPVTLERAALAYAARPNLANNTRRRVESFLARGGRPLAAVELDALDGARLQAWIDALAARRLASSSIGTLWRTLRAIVRYAAARGWIGQAPWGVWRPMLRGVGSSRRPGREALRSPDELARLLAAAIAHDDEQRGPGSGECTPKIAAHVFLGLRRAELAGLRWPDVLWSSAQVAIARQYDGARLKTKTPATLAAPDTLFAILAMHRAALERVGLYAPDGPVFPQARYSTPGNPRAYTQGECLTIRSLRSVVRRAQLPNPDRWSLHSLRDSFVTLESRGLTLGELAGLAERSRHASASSLLRYLRAHSRAPAPPGFDLPGPNREARATLPPPDDERTRPG